MARHDSLFAIPVREGIQPIHFPTDSHQQVNKQIERVYRSIVDSVQLPRSNEQYVFDCSSTSKITLEPDNSYRIHILYHENLKEKRMSVTIQRIPQSLVASYFEGPRARDQQGPKGLGESRINMWKIRL